MERYKNKYRIEPARLKNWDYGSHGLYFITICTKDREYYFGDIHVETHNYASLQATAIGNIAEKFWKEIPQHFPFVELDAFVVMPNHIHGILFFNKPDYDEWSPNKFGPQSQNLASVIRAYKSSVKRQANINKITFEWRSRYYDHVIKSEKDLHNIRNYIFNNPEKWNKDKNNIENLMM